MNEVLFNFYGSIRTVLESAMHAGRPPKLNLISPKSTNSQRPQTQWPDQWKIGFIPLLVRLFETFKLFQSDVTPDA